LKYILFCQFVYPLTPQHCNWNIMHLLTFSLVIPSISLNVIYIKT
jgi:hypothetical protein